MPRLQFTVDDLIDEVRALTDEENVDTVSTTRDILPALNRGQEYAWDILAKAYPDPIVKTSTLTLVSGTSDYDLPEDTFQDRIVKLETIITTAASGSLYSRIDRISYKEADLYETTGNYAYPYKYYVFGRKMHIIPTPSGAKNARMWYIRDPERLIVKQGRITAVNSGSLYVDLDAVGSGLSTTADSLANYANVIDGQTGEVKSSMQISTIDSTTNNRITFRSALSRSTVLGRTIGASMASTTSVDDYLCLVQGTCVPFYAAPVVNFLVQFAVLQISPNKGGGDAMTEAQLLKIFKEQVESNWAGREPTTKIKSTSGIW